MKHYVLRMHETNGRGAFLKYFGIDAENKKQLREKTSAFNAENKDKYLAVKTAFVLHNT